MPRLCMAPYALIVELLEVHDMVPNIVERREMNIHKHQRYIAVKPGFFEASIHGQTNLALCHVVPIARYLFPLLAKLPFPSLSL